MISNSSDSQADRAWLQLVQVGIMAALAVMGTVATIWGSRMTDRSFSMAIYGGFLLSTVGVISSGGPGETTRAGMTFLIDLVLGAIFFERRSWVIGGIGVAVGLLAMVAYLEAGTQYLVMDLSIATVVLVVTGASVRLLRELAVSALVDSRRSEVTDPLTGLVNRRGLERLVEPYWQRRASAGQCVLVMVVDVDHFKQINDTQGHASGDEVLRRLGEVLFASLRSEDVAVRLGGEEFLILCDATGGEGEQIAERLRQVVEDELRPVTVSIGVFETHPHSADLLPDSVWSAVDVADGALYKAKDRGRNCVVLTRSAMR
jgi:diguanylate cyclase (GGDEF)-like protein